MKPKISIITVVLNGKNTIERTIKSVIFQTYPRIEYIIIDGGSTDGTTETIKKYKRYLAYWTSEPDKGIYDAMNKGAKKSTGELLFFLNSDDELFDKRVVSDSVDFYLRYGEPPVFYGGIKYVNPVAGISYSEIIKARINIGNIRKGRMIRHQSMFIKRKVLEGLGFFNLEYPLGADFELQCNLFLKNIRCIFFDRIISIFHGGGKASNLYTSYKEKSKIIKKYFGGIHYYLYLIKRGFFILCIYIFIKLNLMEYVLRIRKVLMKNG